MLVHLPDGLLPGPKVDPPKCSDKDALWRFGRNWVTAFRAFYGEGVAGPYGRLLNTVYSDSDLDGAEMRTILMNGLIAIEVGTSRSVAWVRRLFNENNRVLGPYSPSCSARFLSVGLAESATGRGAPFREATRRVEPSELDGVYVGYKDRARLRAAQATHSLAHAALARMDAQGAAAVAVGAASDEMRRAAAA